MFCPRCKNEITEDAQFCSHCGMKITRCPSCHQPIFEGSKYCTYCGKAFDNHVQSEQIGGYYQPIDHSQVVQKEEPKISFKEVIASKKVNIPVIIISIIILITLTAGSYIYLQKTKDIELFKSDETVNDNTQSQTMKVNGSIDEVSVIGNINQGGHVAMYKNKIYISDDDGQLVCMNNQLEDRQVLIKGKAEYVNIVDDVIYYTDDKNQLCSIGIDGQNQKVIVNKKAYYVVVKDNKIYYQSDTDEEKIFVYDLKTNKNIQLNNRRSYNLNIVNDKIYYTSSDGIYCVGIDGKGDEKLVDGKSYTMTYDNQKLYYGTDDYKINSYDIKTQKIETIIDEVGQFVNMNERYIFYRSSKGLNQYDMKTKESKNIYSGNITYCEILGDKLVLTTSSYGDNVYKIIIEQDGSNQQRLFQSQDDTYI